MTAADIAAAVAALLALGAVVLRRIRPSLYGHPPRRRKQDYSSIRPKGEPLAGARRALGWRHYRDEAKKFR